MLFSVYEVLHRPHVTVGQRGPGHTVTQWLLRLPYSETIGGLIRKKRKHF